MYSTELQRTLRDRNYFIKIHLNQLLAVNNGRNKDLKMTQAITEFLLTYLCGHVKSINSKSL